MTATLAKYDWVFFHRCGCPRGVMVAAVGGAVLTDEETAWIEFFDTGYEQETKARIYDARRQGVTAKLMSHAQYSAEVYPAMTAPCPHGPVQMAIEIEAVDAR